MIIRNKIAYAAGTGLATIGFIAFADTPSHSVFEMPGGYVCDVTSSDARAIEYQNRLTGHPQTVYVKATKGGKPVVEGSFSQDPATGRNIFAGEDSAKELIKEKCAKNFDYGY